MPVWMAVNMPGIGACQDACMDGCQDACIDGCQDACRDGCMDGCQDTGTGCLLACGVGVPLRQHLWLQRWLRVGLRAVFPPASRCSLYRSLARGANGDCNRKENKYSSVAYTPYGTNTGMTRTCGAADRCVCFFALSVGRNWCTFGVGGSYVEVSGRRVSSVRAYMLACALMRVVVCVCVRRCVHVCSAHVHALFE